MSHQITPSASDFCVEVSLLNGLDLGELLFDPGMLFRSRRKWWAGEGMRTHPHEGLDICRYRNAGGKMAVIGPAALIPALYDGEVVGIIRDFIGRTIFLKHAGYSSGDMDFHTIYAHTEPSAGMSPGTEVKGGAMIASLSAPERKNAPPAHLHLSAAWIRTGLDFRELGWDLMNNPEIVTLVDPLPLIGCRYSILPDRANGF